MNEWRSTAATALRVLQQLRADPRTVVMLIAIPSVVLTMLYYMFSAVPVPPGQTTPFDRVATAVLGIMPFTAMFLVTSIAVLRERSSGTLERVLSTPISKGALMAGYAAAFTLFAAAQAAVACALAFGAFDLTIAGSVGAVIGICVLIGALGIALGLLCSAFAQTEFQAMQFMPALVFPAVVPVRSVRSTYATAGLDAVPVRCDAVDLRGTGPGADPRPRRSHRAAVARYRRTGRIHRRGPGPGCGDASPAHRLSRAPREPRPPVPTVHRLRSHAVGAPGPDQRVGGGVDHLFDRQRKQGVVTEPTVDVHIPAQQTLFPETDLLQHPP